MPEANRLTEWNLSEKPALDLLRQLGWTVVKSDTLHAQRKGIRDPLLYDDLEQAIARINPDLNPDNVRRAVKRISQVQAASTMAANQQIYDDLANYFSLRQEGFASSLTVKVIDFDHPENNTFVATNQYQVLGHSKKIIPDIVLFVNGLPLVTIECKSPTINRPLEQGIKDLLKYQKDAPRLFEHNQVLVATSGAQSAYAAIEANARFFHRWRVPYPVSKEEIQSLVGRTPTGQDILLASLFEPDRFLDYVRNFTVYEAEQGRLIKKIARYQQVRAVNKAMDRIMQADTRKGRGGVIWHTQGSGKSLTMLWLALKLRRPEESVNLGEMENPTVVVVTDRTDLDRQITATFQRVGFPNPVRARGVDHLQKLLETGSVKTILTTIQKFQTENGEPYPEISRDRNIVVMVDEAHRTQYKGLATNMRTALPNAVYFGFSGTPIDKKDRSTPRTFGSYIDTYTIQESVADKATVEIRYDARLPSLHVEGTTLNQLFDRVFRDVPDEERQKLRSRYANERAIAAAPKRIEQICLDIIDHYEQFIAPNGFKAQIVTQSRDVAQQYLKTLRRFNAPECALVMSGSDMKEDWLPYASSDGEQARVKERFLDRDDSLKMIIVCDMWLTGFDAPIEQVMYLDSPLREHNLLQAIARVNRTAPGKTHGLVVDYWGIASDLRTALEMFNTEDVQGAMHPVVDEQMLAERHRAAMRFFEGIDRNDIYAHIDILEPEDVRSQFDIAFRRFSRAMDMMMPDPVTNPYRSDLAWLGKVRMQARNTFREETFELSPLGAKVQALINEHVRSSGMQHLLDEPLSVLDADFVDYVDSISSNRARAQEVEHAIRHEIRVRINENPVFYGSLQERLDELLRAHQQRRLDDLEYLKELFAEREEIHTQRQADQRLGLQVYERPFFNKLRESIPDDINDEDIATLSREAIETIQDQIVIDWALREDVKREMRKHLKRRLRKSNLPDDELNAITTQLVSIAEVWFKE